MTDYANEITLSSDGLLSKFGFNDGDDPEPWLDYCEAKGIDYNKIEFPLVELVRRYLLPVIEQDVTVIEFSTCHNPIRVDTVNGVPVHALPRFGEELVLTPESITVPMSEVAALAMAEAAQCTRCTEAAGLCIEHTVDW